VLTRTALERVKQETNAKQYQLFDLYVIKQWSPVDIVKTLGVTLHQVYKAKTRVLALVRAEVRKLERSLD